MKSAPLHEKEAMRLAALARLEILDTLPEKDFNDITLIASQICDTPISLVSLVDERRQWFKSSHGLGASETPREFAFCAHAILQNDLFIIPDSRIDPRFTDNPLVNGAPNVIFYAGAPLMSPDGYPIGTLCVIDTKPKTMAENQKSALKALSSQLSRLLELRLQIAEQKILTAMLEYKKTAIENLVEGVVLQDTKFKIIEFNAAALEVLGMSADQLTGKSSLDPDWRAIKSDGSPFPGTEHPAVISLTTGKKQVGITMGVHRANSELRWIEINSTPIFAPNAKIPLFAVTSFIDITAKENAKAALEKSQNSLKRVLDGVPAMIGHWSHDLINISANRAYGKYFGKSSEKINGKSMLDLLGNELFNLNYPFIEKVLKGETVTFERSLALPDGSNRNTMTNYLPEFEKNQVIGFFVIVTDITEIKNLELQRQLLAAKMIESAKLSSLGEMAGGIAHEINTPLAIIAAKTTLLIDNYSNGVASDSETITQLNKIRTTTNRIAKTVKGLRLFSRNTENDPKDSISVSSVLESTLDLCQERITQAGINLIKDFDCELVVLGRAAEVSQILMNLISNSIDAISTLSDKWIKFSYSRSKDMGSISITDSGTGIPKPIAEKIMNPFFTTKEVGKGTGLGLSISKGIVESYGGKLFYDSTTANTRFVIELPLAKSEKTGNPE